MSECKSCLGCKFLYGNGSGYSNYTWMETYIECALDANTNLTNNRVEEPYGFSSQTIDKFKPTMNSRCELFKEGEYIVLDPDREIILEEASDDIEQIVAIKEHSGL